VSMGQIFRILAAKFRLPSGEAANRYGEEAKAQRDLDELRRDDGPIDGEAGKSLGEGALHPGD
jgi:predicted DNA-binding transcriptional regulator YafY